MRYFAPNLLPGNKWFRTRENVQVDDLVLELDHNHKRSKWKLARKGWLGQKGQNQDPGW